MRRGILVCGSALLLAAGCGAASTTSRSPSSPIDYAAQYMRLSAPLKAVGDAAGPYLSSSGLTPAQIAAATKDYDAALETFDSAILRAAWPPRAVSDIHALAAAASKMAADFKNVSASPQTFFANLQRDGAASVYAAVAVQSDLGIPPPQPPPFTATGVGTSAP